MSINAAIVRKLASLGVCAGDIADLCELIETAKPDKSKGAERQARYRAARRNVTDNVTRDVTGDVTPSPDKSPPDPLKLTSSNHPPSAPKGASSPKRPARRCPESWSPSEPDLAVGAAEGFSPGEIERQLAKFRDHEFKTARSDWSASFRNWLRNERSRQANSGSMARPAGAGGHRQPASSMAGILAQRRGVANG